jgi:hypothetical protein
MALAGLDDWFEDQPAVRDEGHEEPQHGAHDDGCYFAVLGVHPMNTRLSIARTAAAVTVSIGRQ